MNLPQIYDQRAAGAPTLADDAPFFRGGGDDEITISFLIAMLRRRLRLMLAVALGCFALGLAWTLASPQVYEARADVVLLTGQRALLPSEDVGNADTTLRPEEVETQIQLIVSREMAAQVYEELDLGSDLAFRADILEPRTTLDNIRSSIGLERNTEIDRGVVNMEMFENRAVAYLMRALEVERVGNSFNLRINVADSEPERAAQIANTYARLFTTDDARQQATRNQTAARVLGDRLAELRAQANSDFAAVQAYRVRNDLLSQSATSLSEQEISSYNQQIGAARAEAAEDAETLASARSQLSRGGAGNVGQGTTSAVVGSLRSQRAQLTVREADLARRYLERHPELITVREQIADIDRQIDSEINREIRALEASASASAQRLSSLLASRAGTTSQLRGDNTALVALTDLERQATSSQALYESYLQRYNEVMAGSGAEQPTARTTSLADVPVFPVSPNWPLMLGLSALVGLVLGVLVAILSELGYRGITTLDDAEAKLGVPGLGGIPAFRSVSPAGATPLDTVHDYPDGPFAESLRNVLVSIGRAANGRCAVIAVTSSIPGEGKTTLAACMGRAIALTNQSVVVVDCDVIRSQLSRMFDLDNGEVGLAEALEEESGEISQYQESDSGMRILPITRPFKKGERLTENGRMHRVIARLREQFDFVILDCPPILPIAETREIVALADHVVLVVAWRKTLDKIVLAAVRQLPRRVLAKTGIALNKVDMKKQVRFGGSDAASFYKHYESYYG
jgi:succinoglycan biosynthesis transport protein ExoP